MTGPVAPVCDAPDLGPTAPADADELASRAELVARSLCGMTLSGELLRLSLDECTLDAITVEEADLSGLRLRDCQVTGLDAPSLRAARGEWQRVELARSRVGGAEWYDARWRSVAITDTRLGFVNLRGSTLSDVELSGCKIDELDLGGARLDRVRFAGCTIGTLDLTGAELTDVDLRGAELSVLTGVAGLRGATVDNEQLVLLAPLLADHLGLRVEP